MKEKGILVAMLCTVVIVMAVAFAAFSSNLKVNGTASIDSTWNVAFDADNSSCSDGSSIAVSGTTATLAVSLETPGDEVTCTIGVKNTGSLDAKLASITSTPTGTAPITFTVTPSTSDLTTRPVLAKQTGTESITVKVSYNSNVEGQPDELSNTIVVAANYEQYFG